MQFIDEKLFWKNVKANWNREIFKSSNNRSTILLLIDFEPIQNVNFTKQEEY